MWRYVLHCSRQSVTGGWSLKTGRIEFDTVANDNNDDDCRKHSGSTVQATAATNKHMPEMPETTKSKATEAAEAAEAAETAEAAKAAKAAEATEAAEAAEAESALSIHQGCIPMASSYQCRQQNRGTNQRRALLGKVRYYRPKKHGDQDHMIRT